MPARDTGRSAGRSVASGASRSVSQGAPPPSALLADRPLTLVVASAQPPRGSYTVFSCPSCEALFGDWYLREYVMEARVEDAFLLVTCTGGSDRIEKPHWCRDTGQGQCVDHHD